MPANPVLHQPNVMSNDDVREIGRVQKKYGVTEKDLEAAFPGRIKRKYRENGSYTWKLDIKTNDGYGNHTKDNQKIIDMMSPFWRADQERHGKLQARAERVALKDESGSAHFVPIERADDTAKRNGWRWRMPIRGQVVMRTFGGKLYRCVEGEWVPA